MMLQPEPGTFNCCGIKEFWIIHNQLLKGSVEHIVVSQDSKSSLDICIVAVAAPGMNRS